MQRRQSSRDNKRIDGTPSPAAGNTAVTYGSVNVSFNRTSSGPRLSIDGLDAASGTRPQSAPAPFEVVLRQSTQEKIDGDHAAKTSVPLSSSDLPSKVVAPSSAVEVACLTSFNFVYGMLCGTMGLCILPSEALLLFENHQSVALGFSLGVVGLSQLVCPVVGRLSDSWVASDSLGRRRPFILGGSLGCMISCLAMWISSKNGMGYMYYVSLFIGMISLNTVYSVQCGFVPDFLEESLSGMASGLVAVHSLAGSAIGFVIVLCTTAIDFHFVYPLYIACLCVLTVVTLRVASRLQRRIKILEKSYIVPDNGTQQVKNDLRTVVETLEQDNVPVESGANSASPMVVTSWKDQRVCSWVDDGLTWRVLAECFFIDTSTGLDFFWVFVGRTLYYVGVSVQAFVLYYLRDVVGTDTEQARRFQVGCIALLAQATAASIAYPIGRWTDRRESIGRKPIIYVACFCMSSVYLCFLIAPIFGSSAFLFVLASAALYGAGNGCFLAVDYALAIETIPDKSKIAQAMGIWGVSAFVGSALGPLLWGAAIEIFGGGSGLFGLTGAEMQADDGRIQYGYAGYFAMLVGGIGATAASGAVIRLVRKVN